MRRKVRIGVGLKSRMGDEEERGKDDGLSRKEKRKMGMRMKTFL